jgi:hypothetical protein
MNVGMDLHGMSLFPAAPNVPLTCSLVYPFVDFFYVVIDLTGRIRHQMVGFEATEAASGRLYCLTGPRSREPS